jgi:bifunctional non-homologous end joining protein LigD
VLAARAERGLEGVVAKRLDSPYKPGTRNGAWVKHKHRRSEPFLITAWAPAQPRRPESFFLARRLADGGREPAGSVSLGLSRDARERLRAELQAAELPPRRPRQRVRPVEPATVATVDFHGPPQIPVRDPVLRDFRAGGEWTGARRSAALTNSSARMHASSPSSLSQSPPDGREGGP